jgi:LPXTG-motif cell wall-anchored protein
MTGAFSLVLALAQGTAAAAAPAPEPTPTSPVSVTATASKSEVTVGEAFTLELKATGPAGTTYTFTSEAAAGTLELRTPPPQAGPAPSPPAEPGVHRYEATVFALGEFQLPPIPVRYTLADGTTGEASSAPLALKVVSLLPKEAAEQKLADIRSPAAVGIGTPFWVAVGLAVLLLGALVFWLIRRRRRQRGIEVAVPPTAAVPADVEALRALDALAAEGLPGRGELRSFYIRLTAIAKRYLERRLGAPVLEMTSAETLAFLRAHPHAGELLSVVRDLAEAADRIKFAKGEGLGPEAERHLASVRALVPALEAKLKPPPAVEEGKAA